MRDGLRGSCLTCTDAPFGEQLCAHELVVGWFEHTLASQIVEQNERAARVCPQELQNACVRRLTAIVSCVIRFHGTFLVQHRNDAAA